MSDTTTNRIQSPPHSKDPSVNDHSSTTAQNHESWTTTTTTNYDNFLRIHRVQLLDVLQIPEPLIESLYQQLLRTYHVDQEHEHPSTTDQDTSNNHDGNSGISFPYDIHHATKSFQQQLSAKHPALYGTILVLHHVVTWDMMGPTSFIQALLRTDPSILQYIYDGLMALLLSLPFRPDTDNHKFHNKIDLVNAIADHPMVWSRIVLYRSATTICGTLLPPPYLPHIPLNDELPTATDDNVDDADCTGPFTFQYHFKEQEPQRTIDVSLLYVSPEGVTKMIEIQSTTDAMYVPTIDLVPRYQYPNQPTLRIVRYVVLELLPNMSGATKLSDHPMMVHVKEIYANFIHRMHMVRQQTLEQRNVWHQYVDESKDDPINDSSNHHTDSVYRVYTDSDDPMGLHHPEVGLDASPYFRMVTNIDDADIVYSYQSIFSPEYRHYDLIQKRNSSHGNPILINQFPYEGAFVQKDHLARGILQQHGLPRPSWAIETYDLDVHLAEFVGSVLLSIEDEMKKDEQQTEERSKINPMEAAPLWILKPASGTQSQGHIVTKNVAHILRVNDAAGGRRVAQRYIEHPVCINNRKVDCRVVVMMTSAGSVDENGHIVQLPRLYMHNVCYFRIANKAHNISTPIDRNDHESVLTASHLLHDNHRTSSDVLQKLPQHKDTIQQLEKQYPNAFDWNNKILPQIQTMIRELFNGMTNAYPKMIEAKHSRAVYGVDVMFQISDDNDDQNGERNVVITPKLTEVTFCPANNAICDAYVRDDELYRSYNREIFECLFVSIVSNNISRLQ